MCVGGGDKGCLCMCVVRVGAVRGMIWVSKGGSVIMGGRGKQFEEGGVHISDKTRRWVEYLR